MRDEDATGTYVVWVKAPEEGWRIEMYGNKRDCDAVAAEMALHGGIANVEEYWL